MTGKRLKMVRKALSLIFILLLSINSFAAVVSDNDGSAFITKAEFDSLKNDFQAQINTYNASIDSKIDGAIAAYLAGLSIEQKISLNSILEQINRNNGGTFRTITIEDPEQKNDLRFALYYEGWINWAVDKSPKTAWNINSNQSGEGKVWTYEVYQDNYYLFKYYSRAFIKISASGTVIISNNDAFGYPDTMGEIPTKLGTTGATGWSAYAKKAATAFASSTLTGEFGTGTDYRSYSVPAGLPHTKHKLLLESEKTTQNVVADGTEERTMNVMKWSIGDYSGGEPGTSANWRKWKWSTKDIYDDELISYPATIAYGSKVLLWEGLPIFVVQDDGEVKFTLQKTGTGTGAIRIRAGKFNNGELPSASDCVWSETAPAGSKTYEVSFKVKKNSEYWIKCDNNIRVNATDIVLTKS